MKKIIPILLLILLLISPMFSYELEARTLRDFYKELEEIERERNQNAEAKAAAAEKVRQIQAQISLSQETIVKAQIGIEEALNKIADLKIEIAAKKEEIKALMRFKQNASGDNVYLEYIFGAADFTDFIYRSAIVEQLTKYNDNLINEMFDLIEQNEKLAEELKVKMREEQKATEEFKKLLKDNQINFSYFAAEETYSEAEIKAKREEIKYLEGKGCKMDEDLSKCVDIPMGENWRNPVHPYRPIYDDDMYGWRWHPVYQELRYHYGVDMAAPMRTPVYAAATGVVGYTVYDRSNKGGGTMVILYHNIRGDGPYTSVYMHLDSYTVKEGDFVTQNTIIGYVGNTGVSTGPHLHFQVHTGHGVFYNTTVNPYPLLFG